MVPKFKKAKKTRELVDRYMVVLARKSTYTGNYKVLQHTRTMKRLTNSMGGKNLVLLFEWQGLVECCCRSSDSQMAAVASGYFLNVKSMYKRGRTGTGKFNFLIFSPFCEVIRVALSKKVLTKWRLRYNFCEVRNPTVTHAR